MTGLEWAPLIVGGIGGITVLGSLWFTHLKWEKIKAKVTLLTSIEHAFEVVPAWYTARMMASVQIYSVFPAMELQTS